MPATSLSTAFSSAMASLPDGEETYVLQLVELLLQQARQHRASDIHLIPSEHQLLMQWRIDGVLHSIAAFDSQLAPRLVARLKVLSGLLTYRTDLPQEGRISRSIAADSTEGEVRITTFPTLFGEKAAIRLFAEAKDFQLLADLGLPADAESTLRELLQATSGVILLTGPSGSGKTTTAYAGLRELSKMYGDTRGIMTLEDPVEVVVPGITQSQVRPHVGFDLATGLKSMMRQDPDVIMIGEIRDPDTAECAFQAALTGHLVVTTFHAGSCVEAITRLVDMGIEPYLLRSSLRAVVCQRLLRKACPECFDDCRSRAKSANFVRVQKSSDNQQATDTHTLRCNACGGLSYRDRFVTAELLDPNQPEISKAISDCLDANTLQSVASRCGCVTLRQRAQQAVDSELTHQEEVFRVLGNQ